MFCVISITILVVVSMTSLSECSTIRRDAPMVTEATSSEVMTQRTTSFPEPQDNNLNQIPGGDEPEEGSEVNNILGNGLPREESDYGFNSQISSEAVDIHTTVVEGAAISTTLVDTTLSPSTTQSITSTVEPTVTSPITTQTTTATSRNPTTPDDVTMSTTRPREGTLYAEDLTTVTSEDQTDPCLEPTEDQLRIDFKQNNKHMKFPAIAILSREGVSTRTVRVGGASAAGEEPRVVASTRNEYVNLTCPMELLHIRRQDDLSRRSLCPWTYVADVDQDRYPSTIQVAKCRCPQCIDTTLSYEGAFSNDNICRPVNFRIKVLRRGPCVNGMYMYYGVYEEIPVACACVRPTLV